MTDRRTIAKLRCIKVHILVLHEYLHRTATPWCRFCTLPTARIAVRTAKSLNIRHTACCMLGVLNVVFIFCPSLIFHVLVLAQFTSSSRPTDRRTCGRRPLVWWRKFGIFIGSHTKLRTPVFNESTLYSIFFYDTNSPKSVTLSVWISLVHFPSVTVW